MQRTNQSTSQGCTAAHRRCWLAASSSCRRRHGSRRCRWLPCLPWARRALAVRRCSCQLRSRTEITECCIAGVPYPYLRDCSDEYAPLRSRQFNGACRPCCYLTCAARAPHCCPLCTSALLPDGAPANAGEAWCIDEDLYPISLVAGGAGRLLLPHRNLHTWDYARSPSNEE